MDNLLSKLAKYNKFWVSLIAPLGTLIFVLAPSANELAFIVTRDELYMVVVALFASFGVYATPNKK